MANSNLQLRKEPCPKVPYERFFLLNTGFCLPEPASRNCVARTCSRGEGVTKFQNISLVSFVLNRLTEGGFI